ncbi:DUF6318 family protein [Actinomycetota bacterium]
MSRSHRISTALCGAAVTLALAGCNGSGDEASGSSSSSVKPTAGTLTSSASATSGASGSTASTGAASTSTVGGSSGTPAALPAAAKEHSDKGAEAFARFYASQVSKSLVTNDAQTVSHYATSTCKGCSAIATAVEGQAKTGQHVADDRLSVKLSQVLDPDGSGQTRVDLLVTERATRMVNPDGSSEEMPKANGNIRVAATWTNDGWRVAAFDLVKA